MSDDLVDLDEETIPTGGTSHRVVVPPQPGPVRADRFLAGALPHLSRARIQQLMEDGHVVAGAVAVKPATRLHGGESLDVHEPAAVTVELVPQDLPLDILHQDAELVVISKAAGMVVHPAAGNPDGTLVNALMFHVRDFAGIGGELRPGIVHRLDKDTSGVMVVAKTEAALRALQAQFKARSTSKVYLALVRGSPKDDAGTWRTPYGRHPTQRKRFTSRGGDREAVTSWRVLARGRGASLVEVTLHTGRTHQVRVHFAEHGHPLLGDAVYGGRRAAELDGLGFPVSRHALHAARLELDHPRTGKRVAFTAPLPDDLRKVVVALGWEEVLEAWESPPRRNR